MDDQNKNLILASVLSFIVIVVWFVMFPPPEPPAPNETAITEQASPTGVTATPIVEQATALPTQATEAAGTRLSIDTDRVQGSISTVGGRIDELSLVDYHVEVDPSTPQVTLLKPVGTPESYYAAFGWAALGGLDSNAVPTPDTIWDVKGNDTLTPTTPGT